MRSAGRTLLRLVVAVALVAPVVATEGPAAGAVERDRKELEPDPTDILDRPAKFAGSERRQIVVGGGAVELYVGNQQQWTGSLDEPLSLAALAAVLRTSGYDDWLERDGNVVTLRAALTQAPGSTMEFGPPVHELRLLDHPEVYVSGTGARATFTDITVRSWDEAAGRPNADHTDPRPFVFYERGSTLRVERSSFTHLGSDRSAAYGVTWNGSTGSALDSEFAHNFFGVYTFEAHDIVFRGNRVHDNAVYGFDPHDYSTGLVVEDNEVYGNGSHGIIFSVGVVESVVRNNRSHHNGGNGIVMDFESSGNQVVANRVESNEGDGIVILGSSQVAVVDNVVRGNRVGIRVNLRSDGNQIARNEILGNRRGIELYGGARRTLLEQNLVARSRQVGLAIEAPGTVSRHDVVLGGADAVEVRSQAALFDLRVLGAERGVVVTGRGILDMRRADIDASSKAVEVAPAGVARVTSSRLEAEQPVVGPAELANNRTVTERSLAAWLPIAGVSFLVAAVGLQLVHRVRHRSLRSRVEEEIGGAWHPTPG